MRFVRSTAIAALFVGTALSTAAHAAPPTQAEKAQAATALIRLSQLNLVTKEDLRFNGGGEVEGKIWIGRDALQTGGASTTQVGFAASNGQSTAVSAFNSVTVGRDAKIGFQVRNTVGGAYGVFVGRDSTQEINIQDNGTAANRTNVTIGRESSGGVKVKDYQTTWVGTNYTNQNGLDLASNGEVWVGGDLNKFQGGQNNNVKVHGTLNYGLLNNNSTLQVGGAINGGQAGASTTVSALGNISNFAINGTSTVKTNGSFSNANISGDNTKLYAKGGISNVNNNNQNGPNAAQIFTGANVFAGAVTAPIDPGVPTIASVDSQTAAMFTQFESLSKVLASLTTLGHLGTIDLSNSQAYKFTSDGTNSTGYTVFNVNETIFNRNEFAYDFFKPTTPVIINVNNTGACALTKTCSYSMASNFTGNAAQYNQNVIWNFVDASTVVLDRQFQGTVLAALADLRANVIEGSVVAKNFTMTNEIHLGTFNRNDQNSIALTGVVPEPGQWAMLITGFGVVGGVVRRRRRSLVIAA